MEILQAFLPKQYSDDEIQKMVTDAIKKVNATKISDTGKVIGMVMGQAKGKADGGKVAKFVKDKLSIRQ